MATVKTKINGDTWQINLLSREDMYAKHGENTDGATMPESKTIDFNVQALTLILTKHELLHAYVSYLHAETLGLDFDTIEELFVEFYSNRGYDVYRHAKRLFKRLLKEQGKPNGKS